MRSLLTEAYARVSQQADSGIPAPVSGPLAGVLVVGLVGHLRWISMVQLRVSC